MDALWHMGHMTAVGFEPTQLALVELESTPLDHSGKLSLLAKERSQYVTAVIGAKTTDTTCIANVIADQIYIYIYVILFYAKSSRGSKARLAQSAERKALNLVVVGSSPTVGVCLIPELEPLLATCPGD